MSLFDWLQIIRGTRYCVRRALAVFACLLAARPQKLLAIGERPERAEQSP
jgi:hypothetical protein